MRKNIPLVSIAIPTFNSGKTLEKTLKSLETQSYKNIEIIIADGGSRDNTLEIAKKYKAIICFGRELGRARFTALQKSKGKYLFALDSDMFITKNLIARAVKSMEDKNLDALVLDEESIVRKGTFIEKLLAYDKWAVNSSRNMDPLSGACIPRFFRKNTLLKIKWPKTISILDDAVLHKEYLNKFKKIEFLSGRCIRHYEVDNLKVFFKKFIRYGKEYIPTLRVSPKMTLSHSMFRPAYFSSRILKNPEALFGVPILYVLKAIAVLIGIALYLIDDGKQKQRSTNKMFDYEKVFMGVPENNNTNYLRTFKDDYRIKRLTETLKIKNGKILDIGCGGGIVTENLQYYYPNAKYYGCDISRKAIQYARKLGSGKVRYNTINGKRFPYPNNFFDAAICLDVMEHVPNIEIFIKEIKRVVKNNGQFFIIVPCESQPFTFTWFFQKIHLGDKMTFKRYGHIHPEFTHNFVERLYKERGFIIKNKAFSEHILYQLVNLFIYFIPMEILDIILGGKAKKYSDNEVMLSKKNSSQNSDVIMLFRNFWLNLNIFLRRLTYWELDLMKNISFSGWKLQLLLINKK